MENQRDAFALSLRLMDEQLFSKLPNRQGRASRAMASWFPSSPTTWGRDAISLRI